MTQDSTNLDLLRSFAVLFVLFDHTMEFLGIGTADINWLGRLGVAFFFVHTSLVLMLSLERSKLNGWRLSANFYLRRALRIYPLSCFFVVLASVSCLPQASIHPHEFRAAVISPLMFLSNFTLTQNFFGMGHILGQLWSLPIEVDMYVVLPLLFFLARKWPRHFLWTSWR